jgi:hypothetical protein
VSINTIERDHVVPAVKALGRRGVAAMLGDVQPSWELGR